jgi:Ion channel
VLLVGSYLLSSFVSARWVTALNVVLFALAVVLALRSTEASRMTSRLIFLVLIVGSAVMIGLVLGTSINIGVSFLWIAVVLLGGVVMIVHRVLSFGTVTLSSIFGAVSAYLLVGLMFAAVFAAIDHLGAGHFFANGQPANGKTFQYFSFTTLTTLGYGDFTAAGNGGRSVAVLEALTGQVFLATLVARLVSAFRAPTRRADRDEDTPG